MMPAFFVPLGSLPLAPNGKLDHQALPEVETLRSVLEATYVRPATETERAIARIWQEVLHIEQVGIHDNFFDLGGHSLALVQVHSKLQAMYGDALSLIDMFQYPTISTLATYVSQEADAPAVERHSARRAARRRDALRRRQQLPGERRQGQHGVHHE
jgi:acyl carrier protein